ncbi:acyl-CoA synthetase (AMP-forming)/AMP-acid ligase II [Amycolatopsis sulphurea]|uniref:Acyl-CoA synthetase (AMP-forming)/AMP-acid ligase II n=1 Tax=Amycolatopsis sulphurea TaxID=76022 RepID=A0A2A9FHM0_9PSEU|nr:long-chain fatty acid--CoA ligase [Amycolatopsis sulphurea]PFG50266.1 acyl-CoA synthetase (AMP-forming)/AMP-acid ligase II [Amycolatopsis sulphurea]
MSLFFYLEKGASLDPAAPCLTLDGVSRSYREVLGLAESVARALRRSGVAPGDKVGILSANDSTAFTCVFGISRAGAVWCPINPRNAAGENAELLDLFDCSTLFYQPAFDDLIARIAPDLPKLTTLIRFGEGDELAQGFDEWLASARDDPALAAEQPGDVAALVGTGGTTGRPKGVMLTGRNLETMSAITLMSYPFDGAPVFLALAPLTHAAGVLCLPVLARGGEIVIMPKPDVGRFLDLIERHRVTHTFLPPTLIYLVLGHEALDRTDLSSLQCFWYGAAPMSVTRLAEALERIGPMAQLFGQSEAPMMISTMSPAEHRHPDGTVHTGRLSSAGRPSPLVTVAILDERGQPVPGGERGEIGVRGSLVMAGYYRDPAATAEASAHGWHHTGDIGFLDGEGYLHIVDRAKDMVITGGFNVYSAEVEQALLAHEAVRDCAVIGLPDEKWGERVTAVVELRPGAGLDAAELIAFVKERIGSVKAPKQIEVWAELPRSTIGKVLKADIRRTFSGT